MTAERADVNKRFIVQARTQSLVNTIDVLLIARLISLLQQLNF